MRFANTSPVRTPALPAYDPLECPLLTQAERLEMHTRFGWSDQSIAGFGVQLDAQVNWSSLSSAEKTEFIRNLAVIVEGR